MQLVAPHPSEAYKPAIGDIIFDSGKYYLPFSKEDAKALFSLDKEEYSKVPFILLTAIDENPWESLTQLGIEHERFKKLAEYDCPYTNYTHFGALPYAILSNDRSKYQTGRFDPRHFWAQAAWDMDYLKWWFKDRVFKCEGIQQTLMGSGYTDCTRINDGHSSRINVRVQIDNGDYLLCWAWEWYNK